jgi:hypothetical protein
MATDDASFEAVVELLFKVRTDRTVKDLRIPDNVEGFLGYSPSGSYDEEAFLKYLAKVIPLWTPERAGAADYRIILLDDYRVHNMEVVRKFLFDRGFFRVRLWWVAMR